MNRLMLLEAIKVFSEDAMKDFVLPTRIQGADEEQAFRCPDIYLMRLPDSKQAKKKAPYILHQLVTAIDKQQSGEADTSKVTVRSIFATYNEDEQAGGLALIEMFERFRIALLKRRVIGDPPQFEVELQEGLEFMAYPDDTAPYFVGEAMSVWTTPTVQREVPQLRW